MVYPIAKKLLFPALRLFLKKVKGMKNIPKKGPYIITANHESYIDPFLIGSIIIPMTNKKIHFLAVKGRFWDLWGDRLAHDYAGCVCLDYGKEKAFKELLNLLKEGKIVGMFTSPKSLDGKLKKGKTGVIELALKARVPILPIGLAGAFEIAPRDKLVPNLRRAKMNIGELIYLDKYHSKKIDYRLLKKLTDGLMYVISDLTGKPYNY